MKNPVSFCISVFSHGPAFEKGDVFNALDRLWPVAHGLCISKKDIKRLFPPNLKQKPRNSKQLQSNLLEEMPEVDIAKIRMTRVRCNGTTSVSVCLAFELVQLRDFEYFETLSDFSLTLRKWDLVGTALYLHSLWRVLYCADTSVLGLEGLGDSVKANAKGLSLSPETTHDIVV